MIKTSVWDIFVNENLLLLF
uniref:Uncharacterized protein n=1 Tax=Medicago truncatula TaxID=3880 RepID=I3T332_MEDTR|nr:unknown [Medicago truncatula]